MAKPELIIMARWADGLVGRNTTEEERKAIGVEMAQIHKKWKAAGVRLIAEFAFPGYGLDGRYNRIQFLAVPSMDVVGQMAADVWASMWAKHVQDYSIVPGATMPERIEYWNKL